MHFTSLLFYVALGLPPLVGTAYFWRKHRLAQRAARAALDEQLAPFGIRVEPHRDSLVLAGTWNDCPVRLVPKVKDVAGKGSERLISDRSRIELSERSEPSDRGLVIAFRGQWPLHPMGDLERVELRGPMASAWKVVAKDPKDVAHWLDVRAQHAILELSEGEPPQPGADAATPIVDEVVFGPEGASLLVPRDPTSAPWILHAVDLLVALHRKREPRVPQAKLTQGLGTQWMVPLLLPLFGGYVIGAVLGLFPPGRLLVERVICAQDEHLELSWRAKGSGEYASELRCVGPRGKGPDETGLAIGVMGTPLYVLLALGSLRWASRRRAPPKLEPPTGPPGAYR